MTASPALVHLRGVGEPECPAAHALLSRRVRVLVLEAGEPAATPETIVRAIDRLGVETFALLAGAAVSRLALGVALEVPERVTALVLEAPTAIRDERRVGELATPTLVLYGTRDPVTPAVGRRLATLMPNAHLVFVYAAGAAIRVDRPEAFAEVVGDFLERHEAFVIRRTVTVIHP
jgi:pimeloyl-ACP methyl ester carboxylesterase